MMKKFLASFLTGLLLLAQVAQAQFIVNELNGFGAGGYDTTYDVTNMGTITWSSGSTITGSIDIGLAHPKKEIFLVCSIRSSSARTLTAASTTVGGSAVTKATTESSASQAARSAAFVSLPTMAGSQTITVTYSGTLTAGVCSVFRVRNRPGIGANQTTQNNATCSSVTSCAAGSVSLVAGNITFGAHYHTNANATTKPSGTTVGTDSSSTLNRMQTCYRAPVTGSSSPNDSWSWSGSDNAGSNVWVFG